VVSGRMGSHCLHMARGKSFSGRKERKNVQSLTFSEEGGGEKEGLGPVYTAPWRRVVNVANGESGAPYWHREGRKQSGETCLQ